MIELPKIKVHIIDIYITCGCENYLNAYQFLPLYMRVFMIELSKMKVYIYIYKMGGCENYLNAFQFSPPYMRVFMIELSKMKVHIVDIYIYI